MLSKSFKSILSIQCLAVCLIRSYQDHSASFCRLNSSLSRSFKEQGLPSLHFSVLISGQGMRPLPLSPPLRPVWELLVEFTCMVCSVRVLLSVGVPPKAALV